MEIWYKIYRYFFFLKLLLNETLNLNYWKIKTVNKLLDYNEKLIMAGFSKKKRN